MKKFFCIILAAILFCIGALAEGNNPAGSWHLNSIEIDGIQLNPSMLGLEMIITLKPDGSAEMQMSDESVPMGIWTLENGQLSILAENQLLLSASLEDGRLLAYDESIGGNMIFSREKSTDGFYTPGKAIQDAEYTDFAGSWSAFLVETLGMQLPIEAIGMSFDIVLDGTVANVTIVQDNDDEITYSVETTLENGILTIPAWEDSDRTIEMPLQLHADGILSFSSPEDDMILYFESIQ